MTEEAKVVNIHGQKHYNSAQELLKEALETNDFSKFFLLALDDEGKGQMYRYGLSDEEIVMEFETIKNYMVMHRVKI